MPFSLLATSMAAGGLLGTVFMARRASNATSLLRYVRGSLTLFGLALLGLGLVVAGWQLYPIYLVPRITFAIGKVADSTVIQERIPQDMRGRVFGTIGSLSASVNPIGYLLAGAVASAIGGRETIISAGAAIPIVATWQLSRAPVRAVLMR